MGAAEDGRAPTEEHSCVMGWDFCSMGAGRPSSAYIARALEPSPNYALKDFRKVSEN